MSFFSFWKRKKKHNTVVDKKEPECPYKFELSGVWMTELDFDPCENEIIFVADDREENKRVVDFVEKNLDLFRTIFGKRGRRFVYLPTLVAELEADEEVHDYWFPRGDKLDFGKASPMANDFMLDFMLNQKNRDIVGKACLLSYNCNDYFGEPEKVVFDRLVLDLTNAKNAADYIEQLVDFVIRRFWRSSALFSLRIEHEADANFDKETNRLLKEISERVDLLQRKGVSSRVIYECVTASGTYESPIEITDDYRLFLTEFNNKEVVMTPLVKAVFFLFLRHPEGILFKELSDYRDELALIYDSVKNRRPLPERIHPLRKHDPSIVALTDPLNNSINEKCTRIKEAFLLQVHDYIACHYYITGKRGEPKCITLSRENVRWPGEDNR